METNSLIGTFLIGVVLGLGLYLLAHRQEPINIDEALEEVIPDVGERAIIKAIVNDEDAIEQVIARLAKAA